MTARTTDTTENTERLLKAHMKDRAVEIANYMISSNATIREAATRFRVSKSTVHKDVTERLSKINLQLSAEVRKVLDVNIAERHFRGGAATRNKYRNA